LPCPMRAFGSHKNSVAFSFWPRLPKTLAPFMATLYTPGESFPV